MAFCRSESYDSASERPILWRFSSPALNKERLGCLVHVDPEPRKGGVPDAFSGLALGNGERLELRSA